jgi:hypothetical protein
MSMSMSSSRYQPYTRFPRRFAQINSTLGGFSLPYNPAAFGDLDAFYQHLSSLQAYTPYGHMQYMQHPIQVNAALLHVRELGFRMASHDLAPAGMAVLSAVMEPGEGEEEGTYEERGECEGEHEDASELGDNHDEQGEYRGEGDGNGTGSEEGDEEPVRRRQHKPRKPRRPYTVTCALRQTNWFESSMEWENEHFRVVYRSVK